MYKILVVEHIHQAGEAMMAEKAELVFPNPQNAEGILAVIGDCDALVVRNTLITRQIMEAAPKLKVIGRHGVGYDTVDTQAAADLGIPVVYTPSANTESVAELAIGFILALLRKIPQANDAMHSEELLSDTVTMAIMARRKGLITADLWGKTLGVVGVGRIGSSVSRKVIAAFNMRVLGYDPYVEAATLSGYGVQKAASLEEMLPQCDFVVVHCSGGTETRRMINARMLALMKPTAFLINTARGTIVDEKALVEALQSKRIAGAAIDVYDPEPPRPGNPLLHMENVIVTPHLGAMTEESLHNMATMVAQGVLDVLEGRKPQYPVIP
ncbi:MAG: hydroxyacid dehydrogenase [Deltaproteobacteria bacterium]|nr:hydroxyacid dehydrogenase [Deltaproteobacteria bacterium]